MKGGESMSDTELKSMTISRYMDILRIEEAEDREAEIATQKRELRATLESMGVNVETLKIGK